MAITKDAPAIEAKTKPAGDRDTQNFIETHNVTKVARKAVPGSGEESADLLPDEEVDGSK